MLSGVAVSTVLGVLHRLCDGYVTWLLGVLSDY